MSILGHEKKNWHEVVDGAQNGFVSEGGGGGPMYIKSESTTKV